MPSLRFAAAVVVAAAIFASVAGAARAQLQTPGAPSRIVLPADVLPSHYDLDFTPDARRASFTATVQIDLTVKSATRTIQLNAADLEFGAVMLSGIPQRPAVSYDAARETVTLAFPAEVAAGAHRLTISYGGKINPNPAGLFYLDYDGKGGRRRALYTQFENSDARRFLPCWDEPDRKATFTLHATVPAGDMAVSNTPVEGTESLPGGRKRVTFGITPKMSSYLLFFGSGDFERVSRTVDGVQIGIVVRRGETAKAAFALDAAAHILPFYEDYFGVKYPLPKLDLIGAPGSSQFFAAMENWGAIFHFEHYLLVDPGTATEADRITVYTDVAHEMAHQWFGDLVTMDWWDDLWLNEGFADWMELKALERFHPEWHMGLQALGEKEAAMELDARAGTHPIIQPIHDVLQANEAFDTITYDKGMAVIRMLEQYVGEDAFRAGVRSYIKAHAYGNTVSDDLWRELDRSASRPVTTIAHQFTLQAGVPLVRVAAGAHGIELRQDRYATDGADRQAETWDVPVMVRNLDGPGAWQGQVSPTKPARVRLPPGALPLVNAGQSGYFRSLYAPDEISGLSRQFAQLAPADQLGLLNDTDSLGRAGFEPLPDFLQLAAQARPGMDPTVQRSIAGKLASLSNLYRDLPGRAAFTAFARGVLQPLLARVGWSAVSGEPASTRLLRSALLTALGNGLDDPAVINRAHALFETWLMTAGTPPGDVRSPVLNIVAAHADAATWNQLLAQARSAATPTERQQYYTLLGLARDWRLAQKTLDLTLGSEPEITVRPGMVAAVAGWYPDAAFEFATAHLTDVNTWLEPDSRDQYEAQLLSGSHDPAAVARLAAYAARHIPADAQRPAIAAEAAIRYTIRQRATRLPEIDRWLTGHTGQQHQRPPAPRTVSGYGA